MGNSSQLEYWENIFSSRGWGSYPPEELVRFMARTFHAESQKSNVCVLEIGCGPGPNIWYLVREGFSVAGIDGSATAIQQAVSRLDDEGLPSAQPHVDLRVGNFVELPWPDDHFDAVIDIEALYANTMEDIRSTVKEVHRTLKPGGVFFGKMFGQASTGSETGTHVEGGTRSRPTAGPCAGNEIAHFFSKEEFEPLFNDFDTIALDYSERTDREQSVCIYEWLVTAQKSAS